MLYTSIMTLTPSQFNLFESLAWDIGGEVYENYSGRDWQSAMNDPEKVKKLALILKKSNKQVAAN